MKAELRGFLAAVFILVASHAAFAENVTAVTSKQFYEIGELVEFTFTNGLDETIWMNGFPYWWIIHVDTQESVGPCVVLPTISPLGAGQSETWTWDQTVCMTGEPAVPGLYWVGISYWTDSDPTVIDASDPFCIGFGCVPTAVGEAAETRSWGSVKSLYR
jgi:hypothetical protein